MSAQNDDPGGDGQAGFLGRWSRRKQAARTQEASDASPPDTPAAEGVPGDTNGLPPNASATSPSPDAEPEELVVPPSLDEIGADFDLAPWLKRNVPETWKLAALRRAWSNDPAIRDFKGLADYDLDYNTPGMAPGYGPLSESDDVKAMVRQIFGEPEPVVGSQTAMVDAEKKASAVDSPETESEAEQALNPAASQHDAGEDAAVVGDLPTQSAQPDRALPATSVRVSGDVSAPASAALPQDTPQAAVAQAHPVRIYKRRGGAIPV